jgi:HlyD family secretion protein
MACTADVEIQVAMVEDGLLVPNRAITADREAGRYFVNRQKAFGSTEQVEVQIGLRDSDFTQVLEGIEEGDKVVLPEVPTQTEDAGGFGPGGGMFGRGG